MDLTKNVKEAISYKDAATAKRFEWLRGLILLSSTLFGILVALLPEIQPSGFSARVLAVSITLLGLGILSLGAALFEQVDVSNRLDRNYLSELQTALLENRNMEIVLVKKRKVFSICQAVAYVLLALSVVSLSLYVCATLF